MTRQVILREALRALKTRPGERVALLLNDSPEFVAAFIAVCSFGAIAVPINMALQLDEQRAILNDCSAKFAFVENDLCEALLDESSRKLHHLEDIIAVVRGADKETFSRATSIRIHLLDNPVARTNEHQAPEFPSPAVNQPAFILYTSGSTGAPKGAVHCQSDIFYTNETYCSEVLQLRENDRLFSSSRLPFAYGLGNAFTFPAPEWTDNNPLSRKTHRQGYRSGSLAITSQRSFLLFRLSIVCCWTNSSKPAAFLIAQVCACAYLRAKHCPHS